MKLIVANFKMNLLIKDIHNYLEVIEQKLNKDQVIFCPNNLHIKYFSEKNYLVGSQDISFQEYGAITGDTSINQLKEVGITYTIIGHSERRQYFLDDKYINKKVKLALSKQIKIILCIGENLKVFEENNTFSVLKDQLDNALKDNLNYINETNLIIAYEPIWSIGTGKIPTNSCLEKTILNIKTYLKETYNLNLKVLYGGSVNLDNIDSLQEVSEIDGYLVGSLSLDPNKFLTLINKINN